MNLEALQPIVVAKPPPLVHPFPHHYHVASSALPESEVALDSAGLETLRIMPPAEFGGPGDHWSPETLLIGAVSSCFVLTFRAVARARRLAWLSLDCAVDGVLAREQGNSRFTELVVHARLCVPAAADAEAAHAALERAKSGCLITNSLSANCRLEAKVEITG